MVTPFASLPPATQALFTPGIYDVAVTFPTGPASSPDYLQWDFSNYSTNGAITITNIGVVPEPGSVGVLILGGVGLMARRRKA